MPGRIVKEDIDTLRERADVAAIISDHTQLKRAGQRLKGLCPFHSENTPSFTVRPEDGFYYCFGCGEGGDVYDFVMKVEGVGFAEAVEHVARRSGFTLRYEELSAREKRLIGERSRLVDLNDAALAFFRTTLFSEVGQPARDYLKERGFGREDADRFALGYAPNEWEALSRHLRDAGHDAGEIEKVGLAVRTDRGGLRDRFRGRLVFPVRDPTGDIIGFGGRVLPGIDYGDFDPPKYYNSPETPLYHKTRVLYGLHEGRSEIVSRGEALVCEGYTDVMALHQAGLANAVATCGTAVGTEHLRVLARYAQRVVLAFDSDEAGMKAAERAWDAARGLWAEEDGAASRGTTGRLDVRVLALPVGSDPADVVDRNGAAALRALADEAVGVVPFLIRRRIAQHDLSTDEGTTAALRAALQVLEGEPDPELRRTFARSEVSDGVGVSLQWVLQTASRMGLSLDAPSDAPIAVTAPTQDRGRVARPDVTRERARRERALLRIALQHPALLPEEWHELTAADLAHPRARAVWQALADAGGAGTPLRTILDAATDEEDRSLIAAIAMEDSDLPMTAETARGLARDLLIERLVAEERALVDQLGRINHRTDPAAVRAVSERIQAVQHRRRELAPVDT